MEDIAPKLYEDLKDSYKKDLKKRTKKYKPSDYKKAHDYSLIVNESFEKAINDVLTDQNLPDGKLYFNIAERTVKPLLVESYNDVGEFSKETQQIINDANDIGIKAVKPKINQDKIDETISYISNADKFEDVKNDLFNMSENFLQSAVDECVRNNANTQYNRGLNPKIIRQSTGNCCKWCESLAGIYNYSDVSDTGNNVFRRHRACRCIVMYSADGGIKNVTDVYTKKKINDLKIKDLDYISKKRINVIGADDKMVLVNVKKYKNYDNIYAETNDKESRRMSEFINDQINKNDHYKGINEIYVVKNKTLRGGLSAYNYDKNVLFISKELSNENKFIKLVDKNYFCAKNLEDILDHEILGHKKYWDNIKIFYENNKARFNNIKEAKIKFDEPIRKVIKNSNIGEKEF